MPHVEQVENGQVLDRLGHRPVVRRDHEERRVDAGNAAEHVVDEALVAGHIDEADGAGRVVGEVGEAKIDGEPAALLVGQTIGVDARQGLHQERLAVIDVSGRRDDHR